MRIDKNMKLFEGVTFYVDDNGTSGVFQTFFKTQEEALAAEKKAIEGGWCETKHGWMRKEMAEQMLRCELEMQEHRKTITGV